MNRLLAALFGECYLTLAMSAAAQARKECWGQR